MICIHHPVELAGVVVSAIPPCKLTALKKQTGVDDVFVSGCDVSFVCSDASHDLSPNSRIERSEEEKFVTQTGNVTTHIGANIVVLFVK